MERLSEFLKNHVLGIAIFAILTSLVSAALFERLTKGQWFWSKIWKSDIDVVLDGCYYVPPHIARVVIIPALVQKKRVGDSGLRFEVKGIFSNGIAVTSHQSLRQGLDDQQLIIFPGQYTAVIAEPGTQNIISSVVSSGVTSIDLDTKLSDVLVGFEKGSVNPNSLSLDLNGVSTLQRGRCSLVNLVII